MGRQINHRWFDYSHAAAATKRALWAIALTATLALGVPTLATAQQRAQLEAVDHAVISSSLDGRIASLPYKPGEAFKKGDELLAIDCSMYKAKRQRDRVALGKARKQLDNRKRLAKLQAVGTFKVELAKAAVREQRAELHIATLVTKRCTVAAPFAGRVVAAFANRHQSVQARQKVLEIVGYDLDARVIVPANWLTWLDEGVEVGLSIEETGAHVTGHIARIGAAVDAVSHSVPVWVSIGDAKDLRPGMSATAHFPDRPDDQSGR